MPDEVLLSLKQLAAELALPESTVRYYRDAFLDHIPSVGSGRRRRYPPQAIAVLRSIAKGFASGRPRGAIMQEIEQVAPRGVVAAKAEPMPAHREVEEVSNLDLLAAILDGEREQRDALWQMAKEIVRLTEILEGQDKVLVEIADRAGVAVETRLEPAAPPAALRAPAFVAPAPASAAPPAPFTAALAEREPPAVEPVEPVAASPDREPPAAPPVVSAPPPAPDESTEPLAAGAAPAPWTVSEPAASSAPAPAPPAGFGAPGAPGSDLDRLRSELESERALVERLQEARLKLERRAADAEAELEQQRTRRSSVLRRLLGADGR